MRNLTIIGGLIAAFLCFAQNASAQYLPSQIHRDGDSFVDEKGHTLSDRQLIDAIGSNIYQEPVVPSLSAVPSAPESVSSARFPG